ncbi:hypothetical protein V6N11_013648 [Hibiscus sabdariffa]|uniref:Uncharacterized protein n=2 Tax=Hibiscus sabdariffa TaxID=183260 RepID=A0ABR2CQN8_9ROSI
MLTSSSGNTNKPSNPHELHTKNQNPPTNQAPDTVHHPCWCVEFSPESQSPHHLQLATHGRPRTQPGSPTKPVTTNATSTSQSTEEEYRVPKELQMG